MIFRLSHKLNTKINAGTLDAVLLDENLYADWSCHLFSKGRRANISLLSLLPWNFCHELVPTDLLPTVVGQDCFDVVVETYPASLNRAIVTRKRSVDHYTIRRCLSICQRSCPLLRCLLWIRARVGPRPHRQLVHHESRWANSPFRHYIIYSLRALCHATLFAEQRGRFGAEAI